jgi:hypothetical protein
VLFAALGCALVFLVFFVRIVLPGCAFQSELSVIFGAAREGGRERRAGGGIEEQFSFALIACCWSGVVVAARCLPLREIF